MFNHKNLSFKAAMRSLSDPAGNFPPSKEIQGVSFTEVKYEDVRNILRTCIYGMNLANRS